MVPRITADTSERLFLECFEVSSMNHVTPEMYLKTMLRYEMSGRRFKDDVKRLPSLS